MKNKKEIEEKIKQAKYDRDRLLTQIRNHEVSGYAKESACEMVAILTREISSLEWVLKE